MLKFAISRYKLDPSNPAHGKARSGALFRVTWPDDKIGFADLFPWPEFGDLPLEDQLVELSRGHITPLMEQTIWLANRDALLRAANKNSLQESLRIKNHFLITDFSKMTDLRLNEIKSAGFSSLKIKVGRDWTSEFHWLTRVIDSFNFQLRLDFNAKIDFQVFEKIMNSWNPGQRRKIEFVEDPFPFDAEAWAEASKIVPLAIDFEYDKIRWNDLPEKTPFQYVVIKPARQDVESTVKASIHRGLKILFTSSLDHPVGVAHAVSVAAEYKAKHPNYVIDGGCLSNHVYAPNEFSSRMIIQGPYLTQVPGKGIGFDEVLSGQKWTSIKIL